jgi:hypothetical protein
MAKKDKAPAQSPDIPETLQSVLTELNVALARYEADSPHKDKTAFMRGLYAGYMDGLKRAISIVNCEIGIRQNPPNINYPGEKPQ